MEESRITKIEKFEKRTDHSENNTAELADC